MKMYEEWSKENLKYSKKLKYLFVKYVEECTNDKEYKEEIKIEHS